SSLNTNSDFGRPDFATPPIYNIENEFQAQDTRRVFPNACGREERVSMIVCDDEPGHPRDRTLRKDR
ncbi:hypothetical protein, partial [Streptomyces sp. NPDC004533]|uniref:hypothetical protein n=1 Tax=Streptomyces sp. NPDC004533 TaxID=3154278 RepID=UPI0033A579CF